MWHFIPNKNKTVIRGLDPRIQGGTLGGCGPGLPDQVRQ
jgi:hypothetical protein